MVVHWGLGLDQGEGAAYQDSVDNFLASDMTTRAAMESGRLFHDARMPINNPIADGPDQLCAQLEERIAIARKVQQSIREACVIAPEGFAEQYRLFEPSLIHLSVFLTLPLHRLRSMHEQDFDGGQWFEELARVESFLAMFLARKVSQPQQQSLHSESSTSSEDPRTAYQERLRPDGISVYRNEHQVAEALRRDGNACIATKAVEPDVCHIWPFSVNNSVEHHMLARATLYRALLLLDKDVRVQMRQLLAPGELGASDKTWNMITLSPQLHRYWSEAYFGLKWIGPVETHLSSPAANEHAPHVDPADDSSGQRKRTGSEMRKGKFAEEKSAVAGARTFTAYEVEWRWMRKEIYDSLSSQANRPAGGRPKPWWTFDLGSDDAAGRFERSVRDTLEKADPTSTKRATARHAQHGRPLESGHILTLLVETKDLEKVKTLIETQWLAVQMAAMSGAAEFADDLNRKPPMFPPPKGLPTLPADRYPVSPGGEGEGGNEQSQSSGCKGDEGD